MIRETLFGCAFVVSACLLAACSRDEPANGAGGKSGTTTTGTAGGDPGTPSGVGCGASEKPPADLTVPVTSGGAERFVVVHLPPAYDPSEPAPLVLAYHFQGSTPSTMNQATGLDEAADAAGMVIAYPVGLDASFNAGKCCGKSWENGVDDVAFTRDVLTVLDATLCIDRTRVYATGMSGGAMMAYRVGCELTDEIAGIAAVAGAVHTVNPCVPSRAIAALAIHGTADTFVPHDGGMGQPPIEVTGEMMFGSVAESLEPFRAAAGCADATEETYQQGDATCLRWSGCQSGAVVERCTIDGGGHTWPSGQLPPIFGATSTDLNASQKILEFFAAQPAN